MQKEQKFYLCKQCGNMIQTILPSGVPIVCCGEEMGELKANTTDAAVEKHVPDVKVDANMISVQVGSTAHPMQEEHYIQWISLKTNQGSQIKFLEPGAAPNVVFALADGETAIAVYEYCNLHGLWVKEL